MADVNERLAAINPRRRVDRSKSSDPNMPEFPGAVFLHHLGWKTAQVGAWVGCGVLAPWSWLKGSSKGPLFSSVMPRYGAPLMAAGYVGGIAYGYMMVIANKGPDPKKGFSTEEVNARALQIVNNETLQTKNDFVTSGMVGSMLSAPAGGGLLGAAAVGASAGYLAYLFSYGTVPTLKSEYWDEIKKKIPATPAEVPKLGWAGTALQPPLMVQICTVLPSIGLFFVLRGAKRVGGSAGRKVAMRQ